ncbi:hypothetical protein E2C01_012175 [Portunus trituberculatus]|uniref:Uncharacterized protein n=1 Tax=Portunus trituberculatus TaxID=210409 RepID=A0A5B7DDC4_PORTR|nr:hypothetical protein [Portunus trituberculatus]
MHSVISEITSLVSRGARLDHHSPRRNKYTISPTPATQHHRHHLPSPCDHHQLIGPRVHKEPPQQRKKEQAGGFAAARARGGLVTKRCGVKRTHGVFPRHVAPLARG